MTVVYTKSIQFRKHDLRQFSSHVLSKYIFLRYSSDVAAAYLFRFAVPYYRIRVRPWNEISRFPDVVADSIRKDAELSLGAESANDYVPPVLTNIYRESSLDIAPYT